MNMTLVSASDEHVARSLQGISTTDRKQVTGTEAHGTLRRQSAKLFEKRRFGWAKIAVQHMQDLG
jgi:hypothetical protein